MLKSILPTLLIISALSCSSQKKYDFDKTLKIGFQYGDEAMTYEEILFKKVDNKIIGSISFPNTDKLLLSNVQLNSNQTKTLDSFLYLTEKYKRNDCTEKRISSYVQYYTVINGNDTIEITRFCDWENLNFFNIKKLIFSQYLQKLEQAKKEKEVEYFSTLKGYWLENTSLINVGLKSTCELTKMENVSNLKDYIEFSALNKMILHRQNKSIFYDYYLEFQNDDIYINLTGDNKNNSGDFIYGHRFRILKLSKAKSKFLRA